MTPRWAVRLKYRVRLVFHHAEELNRRVAVENYLFMCAADKAPLPDAAKCRELALKLGTPTRR